MHNQSRARSKRCPSGNVKTAYSVRGSDWVWFVDEFKEHQLT